MENGLKIIDERELLGKQFKIYGDLENPLFLWEERTSVEPPKNYLLFAPIKASYQHRNDIYNFIKFSEEERDLHEAKRLLYVAITRAKKNNTSFILTKICTIRF